MPRTRYCAGWIRQLCCASPQRGPESASAGPGCEEQPGPTANRRDPARSRCSPTRREALSQSAAAASVSWTSRLASAHRAPATPWALRDEALILASGQQADERIAAVVRQRREGPQDVCNPLPVVVVDAGSAARAQQALQRSLFGSRAVAMAQMQLESP
ncbi:unnamed protein product [Prorocentrum cordatum]|uniref:Uncharacterized protein n=1 Tax=Prorocentrum cordatum TaxID=2364126 RepID=A0ABN9TRY2_9DINO|nr:unnamed protein product [Polarella glacialis]